MRFLRFTLLQSYILNIQKYKRKALLLINTGIFLSIFAVSSAVISFLIERDISKKQSEIIELQISIKETATMIADLEMTFNQYAESIKIEEYNRIDKQFFSETKLGNKVFSVNDFYNPFIQYSAREIEDLERAISSEVDEEYGSMTLVDLFDINHKLNQDILEAINLAWDEEDVDNFTETILTVGKAYKEIKKINFENYKSNEFQTLEEIFLEINEYENLHINNPNSKTKDDYFTILEFEYAFRDWIFDFINFIKAADSYEEDTLKEINEEILILSNNEKNIILITFFFQFLVFIIIQVFEVNSINFNLKKKLL
tara:strand:+ start:1038 stop:1979 length:942 start_codon:yes stop_codon:yes gene_type:complete